MLHRASICAVALLSIAALAGCKDKPVSRAPTAVSVDMLSQVHRTIQAGHPGRGVTDYPGNTVEDVPKSYAMVLLADLDRVRHLGTAAWPDLASPAGQWLLEHADENRDGIIGWGVPVAWDAYGDGSINPVHTEYSISTGIVIDALLSWRDLVPGPKAREILDVVEKAARPYLDERALSPSGLLPYSLRESDRRYDTFNSAIYLAGQLQRLSGITTDRKLAAQLAGVADKTVDSLLRHRVKSPETGAWYWHYSIQEETPNDLPHASYVAAGLATYASHGGRLAGAIELDAVFAHLHEFLPDPAAPKEARPPGWEKAPRPWIRSWPRFSKQIVRPARSYDLGMALHLACTQESLRPLRPKLLAAVDDYRTPDGRYQKYPVGSDQPPLVVAEYESYLYRGLASCLVATAVPADLRQEPFVARPQGSQELAAQATNAAASKPMAAELEVPFVSLGAPGAKATALYSPARMTSRVVQDRGPAIALPEPGLPIAALWKDGVLDTVVMRTLPAGELVLVQPGGRKATRIQHAPDRAPIFRAAALHAGVLHLVYYDNPTVNNYLLRLAPGPDGYQPLGEATKLPLLEDPAGGTYEMIPRVEFVTSGDQLWLVGGTLSAQVEPGGAVREGRLAQCLRMVEAVGTLKGPVALCANKATAGPAYLMVGPAGVRLPEIEVQRGMPWNLRQAGDSFEVDYASTPSELSSMLRWDLQRAQHSGWLEFGVNNDEGRIPWSQVYYLNGYLDMLALAKVDAAAASVFVPLLADVRRRLDLEMSLIDQHWQQGRFKTRAFTVDRSPALFSVQTARLLLLMDRYATEVPRPLPLAAHADVRQAVQDLRGHIEVLAREGEDSRWLAAGRPHLRWPKGSKFYFDGLGVPFNHQNEWAYSVIRTAEVGGAARGPAQLAALDILRFFGERVAPGGALPHEGVWNYWWGRAFDGWTPAENISVNKPAYEGDKIKAWISFRSIDAMGVLSAYPDLPATDRERLVQSAAQLVHAGKLYPFVGYELLRLDMLVLPSTSVARTYARVTSPWELQSATWALARLAGAGTTR